MLWIRSAFNNICFLQIKYNNLENELKICSIHYFCCYVDRYKLDIGDEHVSIANVLLTLHAMSNVIQF